MRARLLALAALALLFFVFGLVLMFTAYHQDHPGVFLALFFSASLVILISAAILVGLIWRVVRPAEEKGS